MPSFPVWKTFSGNSVMIDSRDNLYWFFFSDKKIRKQIPELPKHHGLVWDIGCNVGFYAVECANNGSRVVAFDISGKCCWMLKQTAELNHLNIVTVHRGFTVKTVNFQNEISSHTESKLQENGSLCSITWREAAVIFGIPKTIKMDIEGGEKEFLESKEFMDWIKKNKIEFICEKHEQ